MFLIAKKRSTKGFSKLQRSVDRKFQKLMVSTLKQMTVPNLTGPGVRRSEGNQLASCASCKWYMETSRNMLITSKTVLRSSSGTMSRFTEIEDVTLYGHVQ